MKIVVIGSSGHAKVVVDALRRAGKYEIVGLIDRFRPKQTPALGSVILGGEKDLPDLMRAYGIQGGIVAIGDNYVRSKVSTHIQTLSSSFRFVTAIHPAANLAGDVVVGDGTVILAGVTVNSGCRIHAGCILNTAATVDHDCELEPFASVAPGVTLAGNVHIGSHSAVGIGAAVIEKVRIGANTVVGAGATVIDSLPSNILAFGTPARRIRSRQFGEKYLR